MVCCCGVSSFFREQIRSIFDQESVLVKVLIYVDCISDGDISEIRSICSEFTGLDFEVRHGPGKGYVANFLTGISETENVEFLALSDHDDVWDSGHLRTGIELLEAEDKRIPVVVGGRTRLVQEELEEIGLSPLFSKPTSFRNALTQSIAGGNTQILNSCAIDLVKRVGYLDVAVHDWWIYQLTTGAGGKFIYRDTPTVYYRQHNTNEIGMNMGWKARLRRLWWLINGKLKSYNDKNISALKSVKHELTPDNFALVVEFDHLRQADFFRRLKLMRLGLYRQTFFGNIAYYLAILLKRV